MTSIFSSFWPQSEPQLQQPQPQPIEIIIVTPKNVVDELKLFHLKGSLRKTIKEQKKQKKNGIWEEILENRKRILKLEQPNQPTVEPTPIIEQEQEHIEKSLEQRIKNLEETVKIQQDELVKIHKLLKLLTG